MTPSPEQPDREDIHRPASGSPTEGELESSIAPAHDPYEALRIPNYRFYALGWMICVIGQQMQSIAIGWQLFQLAGGGRRGALWQGWAGGVQAIPVIVLALVSGHLADRFDRRRLLLVTQSFAALFSLGLAAASYLHASAGLLYLFLGLSATAQAVGWPARSALLPQLVPDVAFANAATWNSSMFQVASVVGPALGGVIVAFSTTSAYPTGAYVIDAVCGVAFLGTLTLLRPRQIEQRREPATLKSVLAGARFVRQSNIILATITLDLFAVLLGGATYLIPSFASEILHVGAIGFGWLRAAPAFGAFAMALVIAHRPPMQHAGRSLLWAVAGFGLATIGFAISRSFILSFIMLLLTGAFDNISVVIRNTLVQMLTPEHMRGRVSAVNSVFIGASNEIGGLESGLTGFWFGAVRSVLYGGIGTVAVVLGVNVIWPQVRSIGALNELRPLEGEADERGFPVSS
jgi:MFS family permease